MAVFDLLIKLTTNLLDNTKNNLGIDNMQVSTKTVLKKTLQKLENHEQTSGRLDVRFSNHYRSKPRTDLASAARAASVKVRA